ncbi:hypothetical protein GLOIN_2v1474136 [Rhizophagus irregularis DAOM 181602=DAOM 197198]|uniref:Uncharacterized protein n=1 Tax=Rhizophagus irregularis (strain DAOM 181602 / DAOM 197198 / MUCL 43194) TaxID=747089 RepID=A0A2P4QHA3_RHIID|nr:hypothetical protein GLOIN_2v1474136 [Rhizophagus irregularis DAOM 181602=DAOM 197198]POG77021.1 hypothetical protein GLOIN_2v1474136 [Rhizophagus irregularis DAOM 181602=DAOM 197198]GET64078.1 hypothetical protein GLOIN_2v1474136 [Rhizophagus irregularis DAOM 181602=DAOM 197198]|eukprot:XP_025183887.1 hypothetical protein GLOIN_2v1474136 [Rhizophagus irregularis DAOM 181602=DAOM 197198]
MSNCTCQSREIEWKKKKIERDYTVDFCHKPLTQKGATKQKVALEIEFLNWFFVNASPHIELSPTPNINGGNEKRLHIRNINARGDANGQFGSVSVLKLQFSTKTEPTAKPTDKTELQNRLQKYCKPE